MIKMMAEKSISTGTDTNGRAHYRVQLVADTAAELVGVTEQGGVVLDFGSAALTADGKVLMLDSDGVWRDLSDGSEVSGT